MLASMAKTLVGRLKQLPTLQLAGLAVLIAVAPGACWFLALGQFVHQPFRDIGGLFVVSVVFFSMGIFGLITIVRRELYQGPISNRGTMAVVVGVIFLLVGVAFGLLALARAILLVIAL
jgi:hypothetical protein